MKNALLILAGGKGKRFGEKTPKQFYKLNNESIIDIFLSNLDGPPPTYPLSACFLLVS